MQIFGGRGKGRKLSQGVYVSPYPTLEFTAAASTDLITAPGHGLVNGDRLKLVGDSLPAPLEVGTDYYARDVSGDAFKVAATPGGAAINLTANGSGGVYRCKS